MVTFDAQPKPLFYPKVLETAPESQLSLPLERDWRSDVPSVSEVTRRLRGHIENAFFDVWVKGEISTLRQPVSGHRYFTLKDANAQMSAVMFRGAAAKLKFQFQEGMEVLAHGAVTVYEARGQYQIVCDAIEPCGIGALQLAFEQLKKKLQAEGLFDSSHKRPLPGLPKHIGIVTSATGAAVRDILKVFGSRFPNRSFSIFPAAVQGDKAAKEIVAAIGLAQRWNQVSDNKVDILIIGRGGGSMEDLWPFNEEIVGRAIYSCSIPTVSAVGHEIDFTIADFVADVRAPTPSAAAEMILPKKVDLVFQVEARKQRLQLYMKKHLQQLRLHLGHLNSRIIDPRARILRVREQLTKEVNRLIAAMKSRLRFSRQGLERNSAMLHSLSPLQVITRGYSLTRIHQGELVRHGFQLAAGDKITTTVSDAEIESIVERVTES